MTISHSVATSDQLTAAERQLQEKLQANKSAAITANSDESSITINSDKLDNTDIPLLKDIFTCLLDSKGTLPKSIKLLSSIDIILLRDQFCAFKEEDRTDIKIKFFKQAIAHHPILFKSFLSTLAAEKINININFWHKTFEIDMINELRYLETPDKYSEKMTNYLSAIHFLYELSGNDNSILDNLLYKMLTTLTEKNQLSSIKFLLNDPSYRSILLRAIQKNNNELLFEAVNFKSDSFNTLLECLGQDINLTANNDTTFLHACINNHNLKTALALSKDINAIDKDGETPLHKAVHQDNIPKLHFLLMHGADDKIKNNEGKTIWDLESRDQSLKLFNLYKKNGIVLRLPPKIAKQEGLNCGFYAIACAVEHLRSWHPSLFKNEAIPARSRDVTPKASKSLRKLRHELGILGKGAIFSVQELQSVIDKTECGSVVIDVDNHEQFLKIIKKSLALNLPIIIPFSSKSGQPAEVPLAKTAHWATIIGLVQNENMSGLLVAQYGKYYDVNGEAMFLSFYNIEPIFPERYLSKVKGQDWDIHDKPVQPSENVKAETIPLTSLENFRRKLVIVTPPNFDLSQLDLEIKTSSTSLDKKGV